MILRCRRSAWDREASEIAGDGEGRHDVTHCGGAHSDCRVVELADQRAGKVVEVNGWVVASAGVGIAARG
jgi:hypothetical protein